MKILLKILVAGWLACSAPMFAQAATLRIVVDHANANIGQSIRADVVLDTQGDTANAIEAQVSFPTGSLELQSISDGASPVSFWIDQPHENTSGTVVFSGIMPGGFTGVATVASLLLQPTAAGNATLTVASATLLRNDGEGTPIPLTPAGADITISSAQYAGPSSPEAIFGAAASSITPEPFTPVIGRDPDVYGGKYFVAFSTTDKGSGMDHYDIAEIPAGSAVNSSTLWQSGQSPYLLEDQTLSRDIYIRAVDHAGNFTIAKLPAEHPPMPTGLLIIIVAGLLLLGATWRWRIRRRQRR